MDGQENSILCYYVDRKFIIDEWFELKMSSRQTTAKRRIDELLSRLSPGDAIIVSKLSRIGRSIKETLNIIESVVKKKEDRLLVIKQNLAITNKILVTVFLCSLN